MTVWDVMDCIAIMVCYAIALYVGSIVLYERWFGSRARPDYLDEQT